MSENERLMNRRNFIRLAGASLLTVALNKSSGPVLGREIEGSTQVDNSDTKSEQRDNKACNNEDQKKIGEELKNKKIPTERTTPELIEEDITELNEEVFNGNEVNIEYLGSCRSEESIRAGPVCSRWSIDDEIAEVGGRGQIVSYGDSPSVWTFGTIKEDSCQPGKLRETCQTQEKNQIFWLRK